MAGSVTLIVKRIFQLNNILIHFIKLSKSICQIQTHTKQFEILPSNKNNPHNAIAVKLRTYHQR